jgi:nucleoside-diphosphate-sugar epimerase
MTNKPSILITGAAGFVGTQLLAHLDTSKYQTIYCLDRRQEDIQLPDLTEQEREKITTIQGDLLNSSTYESILNQVDTVIHLAAVTGKVNPKDYFKINAYATMLLLDRCKKAGVKHFLFFSSIAAAFKNKYRYFYAQSKEQAESYVKTSGLKFTLIRPTMIMGKGSPVFTGLAQLAGLPIIPVFGKGKTRIQPIHVMDVAAAIQTIENDGRYRDEVLELGGPEAISINDFLKKIALNRGKKKPRIFHLPIGLIGFFLSILERVVYGLLPLTVGQLASFRNEGTAEENSLVKQLSSRMMGIEKIIKDSLETGEDDPSALAEVPAALIRECQTFCRYLVKQKPTAYVIKKYHLCQQKLGFKPVDFHDALLLKLAGRSPFFTRMVDAYSRFFRPGSTARGKLAYLFAILEVSTPYFRCYDTADGPGKLGFLVKTGLIGAGLALHLLISALFLFPLQILAKLTGKKQKPGVVEN